MKAGTEKLNEIAWNNSRNTCNEFGRKYAAEIGRRQDRGHDLQRHHQLVSVGQLPDPINAPDRIVNVAPYSYDKAGRMLGCNSGVQSRYGWLDKVVELTIQNGSKIAYEYWPDGQLAFKEIQDSTEAVQSSDGIQKISNRTSASNLAPSSKEQFLWDGLALLKRGETIYINEPHSSGGAVIASFSIKQFGEPTFYINDLLGTTLAIVKSDSTQFTKLSAFGQLPKASAPRLDTSPFPFSQIQQLQSIK